jgi:HSP20 family molecular chaperone IbpA
VPPTVAGKTDAVPAQLPELRSVRLRETNRELVVEVDVPPEVELPQLAAHLSDGVLTISIPRATAQGVAGFHPDATPV